MSFQSIITQQVAALTVRLNAIANNAKKIIELPWQSTLRPNSEIHVSDSGTSYKIRIQQIFDWFNSIRQNQLLSASISIVGKEIKVASGAQWIISNINYSTVSNTSFSIDYAATGYTRNDILVANKNNQIIRVLGPETEGVSPTPPTPVDTVLVTIINVTDSTIGNTPPIIGGDYEKVVNKAVNFNTINDILYPTVQNVKTQLDTKIDKSSKGVVNGVATLGPDGKVPNNQIPALAITDTYPVNSQAEMLALSVAEQGDIAIRSDISKSFILRISPPSVLANWSELRAPTDSVKSVNGQVGNVNLTTADIPDSTNRRYQTDNQKLFNDATSSIQNQLNGKQSMLTNPVLGTGTTSSIPVFRTNTTIGDSSMKTLQGNLITPSYLELDSTYNQGTASFDKLKIYLLKNPTENYGFGLGVAADMQYYAGGSSTGRHRFFTSKIERLTILENGNVGLGIGAPSQKLDVAGSILSNGGNNEGFLLNGGSGILRKDATELGINVNNVERVRIKSNGYVGIGTINPEAPLTVNENSIGANIQLRKLEVNKWSLGMLSGGGLENFEIFNYNTNSVALRINQATNELSSASSLRCTGAVFVLASQPYYSFLDPSGTVQMGYIQHQGNLMYFNAGSGFFRFENRMEVTGTITASGGFFNSDKRLKDVIKRDGDVAYFKWKDGRDSKTHIGYIAQEVQEKNPDQIQEDEDGIMSVNYVEILVQKIRKMEKTIESMSQEIKEMKGTNNGI